MGQIKFMSSLVLIGLFVIAILSFGINFGSENDTRVNIDSAGNYSGIKTSLESDVEVAYDDTNTSVGALMKSTISSQTDATEGGTAFKVGPFTTVRFVSTAMKSAYQSIFGSEFGVLITAFFTLIGIIMGFYIWKTWKGNPD